MWFPAEKIWFEYDSMFILSHNPCLRDVPRCLSWWRLDTILVVGIFHFTLIFAELLSGFATGLTKRCTFAASNRMDKTAKTNTANSIGSSLMELSPAFRPSMLSGFRRRVSFKSPHTISSVPNMLMRPGFTRLTTAPVTTK